MAERGVVWRGLWYSGDPGTCWRGESDRSRIVPNPGLTLLYSLHFLADHVLIGACMLVSLGA